MIGNNMGSPETPDIELLLARLRERIAEHREHLAKMEAEYGPGVCADERGVGLVMNFGDVLELTDEITRLRTLPAPSEADALLKRLEPYVDAIICYASTMDEYEPNRIAKDVRDYIARITK